MDDVGTRIDKQCLKESNVCSQECYEKMKDALEYGMNYPKHICAKIKSSMKEEYGA